jgi:flagellar assembly protein FliH
VTGGDVVRAGAGVFELPQLDGFVPSEPPAERAPGPTPEALLAEAQAQADAIRAQAQADGFAAGFEAGRDEMRHGVEALAAALQSVTTLRHEVADQVERGAVALGLRIAEQALAAAVDVEPERVVDAVRGALRRLSDRDRVTVLVNPEDLDAVRAAADGLRDRLGGIETMDVQAERRVSRGGAVVRTAEGEVDATVETKLARAREVIAAELGRA